MAKINRYLVSVAAALMLGTTTISQANEEQAQPTYNDDYSTITLLEPSTWFQNMPKPGMTMAFNPAHPAGWAQIMNPRTHTSFHMAFTNPATYAQFMRPEFYAQFLNPQNWLAWMNPASYATFLDPNTYLYWMTPHAYIHAMNPDNYLQMFNLANYTPFISTETYAAWVDPAAYSISGKPTGIVEGGAGIDFLSQWLGGFQQAMVTQ